MNLRTKTVKLLKTHDQRPPSIRIDVIRTTGNPNRVMHENPLNPHLDSHDPPTLSRILLSNRMHSLDNSLHGDRTLGNPRRRNGFRRNSSQPGSGKLVRDMEVPPLHLPIRNRVGTGGQRQPIHRGGQRIRRQVQHAFARTQQVLGGLGPRTEPEHGAPTEPERRRHRREVGRTVLVVTGYQHDRRAEVEDARLDGRVRRSLHALDPAQRTNAKLAEIGRRDHRHREGRR